MSILAFIPSQIKIHIIKIPKTLSKKYQKDYDIDIITGHSLGGRDAMILGMSNDIKHIVVYNPAPLAIKDVSGLYADQEELKKLIEKLRWSHCKICV